MEKVLNYIDGAFCPPSQDTWLEDINPATAQPLAMVPISQKADVEAAVQAAKRAFPSWSMLKNSERAHWLRLWAQALAAHAEHFARLESEDNGKPIGFARNVDIPRSIQNLEFFAEAIGQWASESHHNEAGLNYTLRQPRGVVAAISPWNLPLYLFTWKIAPALATGNTVVAKPSELTPLTAYHLARLADDIGMPPGVLNIIHGPGLPTGEAMVSHDDIQTVTFTGGTATGRHIAGICGPALKKVSLELGGKNPNIIFADCDFEAMIATTVRSSFANQGQICLCGSRILIEASIYEVFKEAFIKRVQTLRLGDPNDPETQQGALVSKAHFDKVLSAIARARQEGGRILTGGEPVQPAGRCHKGYFIAPTIIEGLDPKSRTCQEEIFGPVVTLTPFKDQDEAVQIANDTDYGLASSIWTQNITRAHQMAQNLKSGIVWINSWLMRDLRTPFGGMGGSGVGREGGHEALRFFTEAKNVCIDFKSRTF